MRVVFILFSEPGCALVAGLMCCVATQKSKKMWCWCGVRLCARARAVSNSFPFHQLLSFALSLPFVNISALIPPSPHPNLTTKQKKLMPTSILLSVVVVFALVSHCVAQTLFTPAFQTAVRDALVAGGCTDCAAPAACTTTFTAFSAGRIQCNAAGQVRLTLLQIDPNVDDNTAATIGSLTSLDTTSFLVGDTGFSFQVFNNARLATLNIDDVTSFNG